MSVANRFSDLVLPDKKPLVKDNVSLLTILHINLFKLSSVIAQDNHPLCFMLFCTCTCFIVHNGQHMKHSHFGGMQMATWFIVLAIGHNTWRIPVALTPLNQWFRVGIFGFNPIH